MALIKGFRSTSVWRAFILNSVASTLVIFIAITIKEKLDKFVDKDHEVVRNTDIKSIVFTLLFTFLASMAAYTIMYIVFGFGGGMLIT